MDAAATWVEQLNLERHPEGGWYKEVYRSAESITQEGLPARFTGDWFGADIPSGGYALVGCTVAPGFDFSDFEMPERHELIAHFPQHQHIIERLTR
ncbi:MAG: cupin domain-containing protein [Mariprofundus sp.]